MNSPIDKLIFLLNNNLAKLYSPENKGKKLIEVTE